MGLALRSGIGTPLYAELRVFLWLFLEPHSVALPYLKYPLVCLAIGCYVVGAASHVVCACQACLSYGLIMRVYFCITLTVVGLSSKVIIMCITLHGGALIKAKMVSVLNGPNAFLFIRNLYVLDSAT